MKRQFGLRAKSITPFSKARDKLDRAFSELVRQHYEAMGCFTCGVVKPYKEMDCGHFRRRECMSTRFDPRNVGIQCRKDNRFDGGKSFEFAKTLDKLWGKGTANKIDKLSKKTKNFTVAEMEQLTSACKHSWLAYLQLYEVIMG